MGGSFSKNLVVVWSGSPFILKLQNLKNESSVKHKSLGGWSSLLAVCMALGCLGGMAVLCV